LLCSVVKDLRFRISRFHFRLSPHGTVTYCYGACFCQVRCYISQHHHSNKHHSPICQLFIWRFDIGAILQHLGIFHQHLFTRNANIFKCKEAIINSLHTQFCTNFTNFNTWHRFMCFFVSELNNEEMNTTMDSLHVQLCHHNSIICCVSHCTRPPLVGC